MLVPYPANPPYDSSITPADKETFFVMDSGKIVKIDEFENPVLNLLITYPDQTQTELDNLRAFIRANRLNRVLVRAIDGLDYVSIIKNRSVRARRKGALYQTQVELVGTLPSAPDAVTDFAMANSPPIENRQVLTWSAPNSNGFDIAGYVLQHRPSARSTWTQVELGAAADSYNLGYAKSTLIHARIQPYSIVQGERLAGPFSDTRDLLAGGRPNAPLVVVQGQAGGFSIVRTFDDVELYFGYPPTAWHVRYRRTGTQAWTTVRDLDPTSTSYENTALASNQSYDVQAAVQNAYGTSDWSAVQTAQSASTGDASGPFRIADPLNYRNVDVSGQVRSGHGVDRATYYIFTVPNGAGGNWTIALDTTPNSKNWELTEHDGSPASVGSTGDESYMKNLVEGDEYSFRIYAFSAADQAPDSLRLTLRRITATRPSTPRNVVLTRRGPSSTLTFTVQCDAPSNSGGAPITLYEFALWAFTTGDRVQYSSTTVRRNARTYTWTFSDYSSAYARQITARVRAWNGSFWSSFAYSNEIRR